MLLVASLIVICAIVYVLTPGEETQSSSADVVDNQERTTEVPPTLSRVEIQDRTT